MRTGIIGFLVLGMSLVSSVAGALEWKTANQVTLAWTPVTTIENQQPLPPTDGILYRVWSKNEDGSLVIEHTPSPTLETLHVITFHTEGRFYLGVSSVRMRGDQILSQSAVSWSDSPLAVGGEEKTFGVQFFFSPASPGGLTLGGVR